MLTTKRVSIAWLIGVVAVFKFSDEAFTVLIGLGVITAVWFGILLLHDLRHAIRTSAHQHLSQRWTLVVEPPRSVPATSRFLAFLGADRVAEMGWTEQEAARRAEDPQMPVRTTSDERVAMITLGVDPFVRTMPTAHVWLDHAGVDGWRRHWPEALEQMRRLLQPRLKTFCVQLSRADLDAAAIPTGFVDCGHFLRRTASGEREEMCYLTAVPPRSTLRSVIRRLRRRSPLESTELPFGQSYRRAMPLGMVECAPFTVRPLTRFDGDDVAGLIDAAMLAEEGVRSSVAAARRRTANLIKNGWVGAGFVVMAGQEEIVGTVSVERVQTDVRSCAVSVNLVSSLRGSDSELSIAIGLSERLRALHVDFLMVPVAPEHGFDAERLSAHGFVAIGGRPSVSPPGTWETTQWFELDLRPSVAS
ncbi:MAG: hypothetical protein ABMA25_11850 [Ilumatobacteraceae bacterium]